MEFLQKYMTSRLIPKEAVMINVTMMNTMGINKD